MHYQVPPLHVPQNMILMPTIDVCYTLGLLESSLKMIART